MVCSCKPVSDDMVIDISRLLSTTNLCDMGTFTHQSFVPSLSAPSLMVELLRQSYIQGLLPDWLMLHWVEWSPIIDNHSGVASTPRHALANGAEYAVTLRCRPSSKQQSLAAHVAASFPSHGLVSGSTQCTGSVRISLRLTPDKPPNTGLFAQDGE